MRSLPSEILDALAARALVARDFIWIVARDRDTGDPVYDGYWSDVGSTEIEVIDPDTGSIEEREFFGAAGVVSVSAITLVSTISVQNVTVTLSQVADRVNDLVRTYDCKQAVIQIFRALYGSETREIVSPAEPRFSGFIDKIDIKTPSENEEGGVILTCASHTQEMTRSNPDTRSDDSQKVRSGTDKFFADAAVVGEWEMFWGKKQGKLGDGSKKTVWDQFRDVAG